MNFGRPESQADQLRRLKDARRKRRERAAAKLKRDPSRR